MHLKTPMMIINMKKQIKSNKQAKKGYIKPSSLIHKVNAKIFFVKIIKQTSNLERQIKAFHLKLISKIL